MTVPADLTEALKQANGAKARERDGATVAPWKLEERARFQAELRQSGSRRRLELGSGPGHDGRFFLEQGLSVVCIDLCPEMVMLCRVKGLEAYDMDVLRLDFPAASFDAVFALNSLLHVPKASIRAVLQGIHRSCGPVACSSNWPPRPSMSCISGDWSRGRAGAPTSSR